MAIFNEILVGRFNKSLQRLFGIKGSPPVRQLGGEITPSHVIPSGAENRYLEQWNRYGTSVQINAVAAQLSTLRFRNPVASNIIAVLEKIAVSTGLANTVFVTNRGANTDVDLTTVQQTVISVDRRLASTAAGVGGSTSKVSIQNGATAGGLQMWQFATEAKKTLELLATDIHEIPTAPGDWWDIETSVANDSLVVSLLWRERYLEESERL